MLSLVLIHSSLRRSPTLLLSPPLWTKPFSYHPVDTAFIIRLTQPLSYGWHNVYHPVDTAFIIWLTQPLSYGWQPLSSGWHSLYHLVNTAFIIWLTQVFSYCLPDDKEKGCTNTAFFLVIWSTQPFSYCLLSTALLLSSAWHSLFLTTRFIQLLSSGWYSPFLIIIVQRFSYRRLGTAFFLSSGSYSLSAILWCTPVYDTAFFIIILSVSQPFSHHQIDTVFPPSSGSYNHSHIKLFSSCSPFLIIWLIQYFRLIWTKSETRMTARVPKQDSNTYNVQKNAYLLGQKHNLQIFGVIPFMRLQNDT